MYQYLTLSPGEIHNLWTVLQFTVTTYLLYLRISGQFHLIVGLLCLFGFNLPETHHLYYLSSSFNDFWRRINIYWKDFIMKMIYYPVFIRLRNTAGTSTAIVFATVIAFLGTWLLHSYQWFWLRDSFPISATDGIFWGFLGLLVVINSLIEASSQRKPHKILTLKASLIHSAKTVIFFLFMSFLWSLWSSSTPANWLGIVSQWRHSSIGDFAGLAILLAALTVIGTVAQVAFRHKGQSPANAAWPMPPTAVRITVMASLLIVITLPSVTGSLGHGPENLITTLRQDRLNMKDQELADRGYYEGILEQRNFTSALWSNRANRPDDWVGLKRSDVIKYRQDLLQYEMKDSYAGNFKGTLFSTNRFGMRDKQYQEAKPAGIYRIALVGASYEMGPGVRNDQIYEAILENQLNAANIAGRNRRVEILNFSVGGYSIVQKSLVAENKIVSFQPDLVIVTIYSGDYERLEIHLSEIVQGNVPIPYPALRAIIERCHVHPGMNSKQIRQSLQPCLPDAAEWAFVKLKSDCMKHGFPLMVVFMPSTKDMRTKGAGESLSSLWDRALRAGLQPERVDNIFANYKMEEVEIAPWDSHPGVLGHRLLADGLCRLLLNKKTEMFENDHESASRQGDPP